MDLTAIVQKTSKLIVDQRSPNTEDRQKRASKHSNKLRKFKPNFRQRWADKYIKGGVLPKNQIIAQSTRRLFRSLQNLQAHLFRKNLSQANPKIIKIRRSVIQTKKPHIIPVSF